MRVEDIYFNRQKSWLFPLFITQTLILIAMFIWLNISTKSWTMVIISIPITLLNILLIFSFKYLEISGDNSALKLSFGPFPLLCCIQKRKIPYSNIKSYYKFQSKWYHPRGIRMACYAQPIESKELMVKSSSKCQCQARTLYFSTAGFPCCGNKDINSYFSGNNDMIELELKECINCSLIKIILVSTNDSDKLIDHLIKMNIPNRKTYNENNDNFNVRNYPTINSIENGTIEI